MNKKTKIACLFFFLFLFSYMMVIGYLTPKMSDDYMFNLHFFKANESLIYLLFLKMQNIYLNFSGRIIIYLTEYSLFSLPIVIVNTINSIIFCLLIYAIFLNATLRSPQQIEDVFTLFLILFSVWFFIREFAEVVFWKTGAVSYLWPLTGILFFIYPFVQLIYNKDIISKSAAKKALVIIGAFVLSTAHETLSPPICALLIIASGLYYYRNKKIPKWIIYSILIYILGSILLITAPGNFARNRLLVSGNPITWSLWQKFFVISKGILGHFSIQMGAWPLFLLILGGLLLLACERPRKKNLFLIIGLVSLSVVLIIANTKITHFINFPFVLLLSALLVIYWWKKDTENKENFFIFTGMGLIAAYDMIVVSIPVYGNRTSFFSDIFFIIAIFSVLSQKFNFKNWRIIYGVIGTLAIIATLFSMVNVFYTTRLLQERDKARAELIAVYNKNNIKVPILSPLFQLEPLSPDLDLFIYSSHLIVRDIINTRGYFYGFDHVIANNYVISWSDIDKFSRSALFQAQKTESFQLFVKNNILYYLATIGDCNTIADKNSFFLRVYPYWQFNFLPNVTRKFNSLEFPWGEENRVTVINEQGHVKKDICLLAMELPNYKIKKIETGQYKVVNGLKKVEWQKTIIGI